MTPLVETPRVPDWSQIAHDVLCPLCEYNLRGIQEPRCPECGYRFDWPEVFDPARRLHPYLYEHHPERGFKAFMATALNGLFPKWFWSSLNPAQPSQPERLRKYWTLCLLIFLALMVARSFLSGVRANQAASAQLAATAPSTIVWFQGALKDPTLTAETRRVYQQTMQDLIARQNRSALSGDLRFAARAMILTLPIAIELILWPWATLLTLLIFRWSMRRARVKTIHVQRCCLYSFDGLGWAGILLLASDTIGEGMVLLPIPFGAWKLWRAYKYYLRFDLPLGTVLCSQMIVFLVAAQIWVTLEIWGFWKAVDRWTFSLM